MLEAVKATAKQHVNPVQLENLMARPTATQMHSFFRPLPASMIGIIPGKFYRAVRVRPSAHHCAEAHFYQSSREFLPALCSGKGHNTELNNNSLPVQIQDTQEAQNIPDLFTGTDPCFANTFVIE